MAIDRDENDERRARVDQLLEEMRTKTESAGAQAKEALDHAKKVTTQAKATLRRRKASRKRG